MQKQTLNNEEIGNLLFLLQRVDLKGSDAITVAQLQIKLNSMKDSVEKDITNNSPEKPQKVKGDK